ncbi:MAG: hypothetical protein U0168_06570 [Nannocystaceae bacterium]
MRVQIMRADAELALGRLEGFEARTRALAIEVAAIGGAPSRAMGDVHRLLGSYFATVERLDDALRELDAARRLFEHHGEAMLLAQVHAARAQALAVLGRLDDAVAAYHAAIDAMPELAQADRGLLQLNPRAGGHRRGCRRWPARAGRDRSRAGRAAAALAGRRAPVGRVRRGGPRRPGRGAGRSRRGCAALPRRRERLRARGLDRGTGWPRRRLSTRRRPSAHAGAWVAAER